MQLSKLKLRLFAALVGTALINLGLPIFHLQFIANSQVLAQSVEARKAEADRLFQEGHQQYEVSQIEAALQSWQQALIIYREIKDRRGEGQSLGNLGIAYGSLGDYPKAIEYNQQLLAIAREIKDRLGERKALGNLGLAYRFLGDYPKAIEYNQQSLAIAREIKDRLGEGGSLGKLGNAYYFLGDYPKAIDYHQQYLAIAREIKDRLGEGESLGNLGNAYYSLGDYPKAIKYQQQSLAIAREIKDRHGEGQSLGNLGSAYHSLGDYPKAIDYHQQYLAIAREIKDRHGEGVALSNLGSAYSSLRDYPKAIDYHQQFLAIAREIKDRYGEGTALGNLGNAYYSLGDYPKAIDYHQQSLAIAREIKDRHGEGRSLNNLGRSFQKSGNLVAAETTLKDGIAVTKKLRETLKDEFKISIFEEQARTYRTLQEVLIAQNKTNAALEISEAGRARAFVDLLARQLSLNATEQLTVSEPSIEQIQQIAKTQNATLVEYSIIGDEFKVEGKPQTKESQLYIWVVKPTGEISFRAVDLKPLWQQKNTSLKDLVADVRCFDNVNCLNTTQIAQRSESGFNQNAQNQQARPISTPQSRNKQLQQLHRLLIQTIADLLPTNPDDHVIFMPQGELFLVPFPALIDANNKYLIEKHTILTAPSIQTLDLTRQQRQKIGQLGLQNSVVVGIPRGNAVVVGNPTMPSVSPAPGEEAKQLPSLPGAEDEANAIAPLINTQAFTGAKATKAAVVSQMPNAKIIHLATHGLLDEYRGLGSAIALAPTATDNGLLTAEDILKLKLNAELVVLSACNTGRGRITGDGVVGLSRSFISAGVPSIIVSLWAIPDSPTAFLMSEFYKSWQQDPNKDKAKALRKAMLATMKERPAPENWAAFTLIGEAQ